MATSRLCSIPDCGKPHYGRSYCLNHYSRFYRYGDPEAILDETRIANRAKSGLPLKEIERALIEAEPDKCWLWTFWENTSGYGRLWIDGKRAPAHRIVCERKNGPPPSATYQAAHSCGNRLCINHHHLRWATPKENSGDKVIHGTMKAKLTEVGVREIRERYSKGATLMQLSEAFGVSKNAIHLAVTRRTWANLE